MTRCKNLFLAAIGLMLASIAYSQDDTKSKSKDGNAVKKAKQDTTEKKKSDKPVKGYGFKIKKSVEYTDVKSQDQTGTCWCFAGASFLESELLRQSKGRHNLSEMFIVKNVYKDKAQNYVLRNGKANFSQGALAHDFINAVGRHGVVPEELFSGLDPGQTRHNHDEMEAVLKGMLEAVVKQKTLSKKWRAAYNRVLDVYIGEAPEKFKYGMKEVTPKQLSASLGFNPKEYVSLTSYTHHPFYENFVLEIPDNYSNGSFYNVPIDELVKTIDHAISNGYSVAWDGDVSERSFSAQRGIAVLPETNRFNLFQEPGKEKTVTQEMRQETFNSYSTTDDHLMHLTGISYDKNGNKYYVIKNSWGKIGPYKGLIHMSEAYVRLKTVAIMLHKDGLTEKLRK